MTDGHARRAGSPAPALVLEDDDLLSEILLRLPPAPSSVPRVSVVCKRWRSIVYDAGFLRRFRARHRRNPPLLGFFSEGVNGLTFTPTLEPSDRIAWRPTSVRLEAAAKCHILGCRHGLVLFLYLTRLQVLVWDPVAGDLSSVAVPPGFDSGGSAVAYHGAVIRGSSDVQGGGHSIPFQVVLVGTDEERTQAFACVYSSETGLWGNLISTPCSSLAPILAPSTLIGASLYWFCCGGSIGVLELDLDRQLLAVIDLPMDIPAFRCCNTWIVPVEGNGLGFLHLANFSAQLWKRETDFDGVARWVLRRTVELDKLLSLNPEDAFVPMIFGFAEEDNVSFIVTSSGIFVVQLESMQFKKPFEMFDFEYYYPFASVLTPYSRHIQL